MRFIYVFLVLGFAAIGNAQFTAYLYPQLTGNQSFGGALGMDFDVNQDIRITALGVFDSGQNGIQNNIDCFIYNRETQQIVASRFFSPGNQGHGDGRTNFLDLASPLFLPAGFKGSIVAQGYGILEKNGNSYTPGNTYASTLNTGGGLISFTGKSRNGSYGLFPTTVDLNVAQYGAGNFKFVAANPVPEPTSMAILAFSLLSVHRARRSRRAE